MCQNRKIKQSFKNINSTHFRNSLYSSDTCQYWLTKTNKKRSKKSPMIELHGIYNAYILFIILKFH